MDTSPKAKHPPPLVKHKRFLYFDVFYPNRWATYICGPLPLCHWDP